MAAQRMASWTYAEHFPSVSDIIDQATRTAEELDADPVPASVGSLLRMLAASVQAAHVVEIGTGAGISGLWLLGGMADDGVLTSIDLEPEHQRSARRAFAAAGVAPQRTRVISGDANQVLPRLTDAAYDLVWIDADVASYPVYVEQAMRLLRPGGLLAVHHMLGADKVADPAARDASTVTLRDLGKQLRADERLVPALVAAGDGLLVAVRR
ncbi:MAG: O-methyltransferase [Ornithinimicrobium sp.]|jgi:predicted O-methyltransferase YrrM|uniref:O-methyltransferase n=1 Tax=Ornithinimicrobium sp. TaxID=1977084 RepID=UPI0017E976DE|nr:O-methyltransferase [Actinomycetota bacterium]